MGIVQTAEDLVGMLRVRLRRLGASVERRKLEAELWTYRKTVNRWRTVAPREEQARALFDLLLDLEARTQRCAIASKPPVAPRHELPTVPGRTATGTVGPVARTPQSGARRSARSAATRRSS
ncbi:MAG: hypothetical protein J0I07_38500 [Myxococcales bacterium]|nr:hypothetical protein [Myxococcales bacterium]